MDGCLHVVSLDSHQRHTLPAHTKPVSVVRCGGGRVVSGGYDGTVVVHRMTDLERERTITSAATMCVSGCSGGVVCYWEVTTGNCRHLLQESGGDEGVSVVKLDILVGGVIVGLMSDETVVVWDKSSGESLFTIALEGVCPDIALLGGGRYMAASVESLIVVYDLESGQKRFQMQVGGGEMGVVLVRHLLPLQGTHVVCSTGRDLRIFHCGIKMKID
ncbi:Sterol regulatory element-binding protein cleavage-activating protein [Geodia barretti]|uniref:Sterol regulatory element-binding protein cleavage-activating protein n=1 Tax=Geodia barretti TaxID=519541 RepID=A0AA35W1R7_GEOBA|nr:Sterol regulatory element-binding protein cleavage-activating protein [Geodia barretti]